MQVGQARRAPQAPLARVVRAVGLVAALALAPLAGAASEVALTLVGAADGSAAIELGLEELEAMPQVTVVTENEFVDGAVAFRGPLVRDVIARMEPAEVLRFTAANDYYVDIPTSDFVAFDAILAIEADGRRLSRRDKGPLWLIYPMSDHPELRDPTYISRLIWQVVRIETP
jgi:hypothetical protein